MGSVLHLLSVRLMVWTSQWPPGRSSFPLTLDLLFALMATVAEVKEEKKPLPSLAEPFSALFVNPFIALFCFSIGVSEIILPSNYENSVGGLCGNYDSITNNEYMKPDGTVVRDLNTFGESWRVSARQADGMRIFHRPHTVHRYDHNQGYCAYC